MSQPISLLDADQVARAAYDDTTGSANRANWSIVHNPAAATAATITKAAVAGSRHVCNAITLSLAAGATAQTPITVYLRDGATGAGAILWTATLSTPVNTSALITHSGLFITGTSGNAMTLEFSAAGVAASLEAVTLTGWTAIQ